MENKNNLKIVLSAISGLCVVLFTISYFSLTLFIELKDVRGGNVWEVDVYNGFTPLFVFSTILLILLLAIFIIDLIKNNNKIFNRILLILSVLIVVTLIFVFIYFRKYINDLYSTDSHDFITDFNFTPFLEMYSTMVSMIVTSVIVLIISTAKIFLFK